MKKGNSPPHLISALLLFLAAFTLYSNTLSNRFALDDLIHIVNNPSIRNLDTALALFQEPFFPGNLYRPFLILTYAVTYHFVELSPFVYHLTNVLLHSFITLFIYLLLIQFLKRRLSFIITFFFAIHPIHVEAVANISGRSELLTHFLGLSSLLLFLHLVRNHTPKALIIPLLKRFFLFVLFLCALLSKESALCYLLLALLPIFFLRPIRIKSKEVIINYIPFLLATLIYLLMRSHALGSLLSNSTGISFIDNPLVALPPEERIANAIMLLAQYIHRIFIPSPLSGDYSYAQIMPIRELLNPQIVSHFILVLTFLLLGVLGFKRRAEQSFFVFWFFCSFAITCNILFPIGTIFGERLMYLPSLGVIGLMIILIRRLQFPYLKEGITICFTTICACQTVIQNTFWRDNKTLFERQIKISPASAKVRLNYGIVLRNEKSFLEAKAFMLDAYRIYPRYADATFGLATAFLHEGDQSSGEEWIKKTLALNSTHIPALNTLAKIFFNQKNLSEAKKLLRIVQQQEPKNFDSRLTLLAILLTEKRTGEAKALRDQLIRIAPRHRELIALSRMLDQLGDVANF